MILAAADDADNLSVLTVDKDMIAGSETARLCYYQGAEHEDSVWENGLYQFFKRIFKQ